jgi:hypothetical protein
MLVVSNSRVGIEHGSSSVIVTWAPPPKKRGRPRRRDIWSDREAEQVIRLAALEAQGLGPYEAARLSADVPEQKAHLRQSTCRRLVRKCRSYFPAGLASDHPFNLILVPGMKFGTAPDPLAAAPMLVFNELWRHNGYPSQ